MTEPLTIESPQANINRARFAAKDFFTFVDDLIARIQVMFVTEFDDFVASGVGQMLIDIVSWACETLSFYIDRQAAESYLETALTRRAVNRLARQLGYKMVPAVAASVDLDVNLTRVYAFDVPIPIGFQFRGTNGTVWEATESITFPAGEGPTSPSRTISVREGVTVVEHFRSDGSKNQAFRLSPGAGKWIAQGTFSLTVTGAPWAESEFITYDQTNQYEVDYNTEPPLLRFGDSIAGNIPIVGSDLAATYMATMGAGGLITSGSITSVVTPLVVAFTTIPLTINNPLPSSGGANREELIETKRRVPFFFKARNVAVTREDYIGLSQAYSDPIAGTVAVAQAFVALGAGDDLQLAEYINDVMEIVSVLKTNVQVETASAAASVTAAETARLDAVAQVAAAASELTSIASQTSTARTNADDAKTEGTKVQGQVAAGLAKLGAIATGGPSTLLLADKTELQNYFNDINGKASTIKADADNVIGACDSIDSSQVDATTVLALAAVDLAAIVPLLVSISADLADIDALVSVGFETAVEDVLDLIYAHVDGFLANGCQANLVQVPIATKDVDGFLTAPSTALVRSLQAYLEARKEVTQVVNVISGEPFLVRVDIVGLIGVVDGYVQAGVLSQVRSAVDDLLRDRAFGENLWLSDLHTSIAPDPLRGVGGVEGVRYAIFHITGPVDHIDSDGNLIVPQNEVITKGTVTITGETAQP